MTRKQIVKRKMRMLRAKWEHQDARNGVVVYRQNRPAYRTRKGKDSFIKDALELVAWLVVAYVALLSTWVLAI